MDGPFRNPGEERRASAVPNREDPTIGVIDPDNTDSDMEVLPSEETPLLSSSHSPDQTRQSLRRRALFMCLVFIFLVEVSQFVMEPPLQKILEDIICRNYHPDHLLRVPRVQDQRCKNPDVQKTLAMVRGWSASAVMAVPILVQIPFGIVADKYGRRPVLFLAYLGSVLQTTWMMVVLLFPDTFSVWAILPSFLCLLIGGGDVMITAMVYTIIADVVPVAERAATFYRLVALVLILNVVINALSAYLMSFDPWLAMWLGFVFVIVGLLSSLLIPETVHLQEHLDGQQAQQASSENIENHGPKQPILRAVWQTVKTDIVHVWRFIFASKSVLMLIIACATYLPVRLASSSVQLQYMTKRFNWEWSKATYISTFGVMANVVVLLVFLPVLSTVITRKTKLKVLERDLYLTRGSIIFMTLGTFSMAFAAVPWLCITSLIIMSMGYGFNAQSRALLNAIVEPHTIATLNTTIGLIEMLIGLGAAPALAWLLSWGIGLGGVWYGLPYLAMGLLLLCVTVIVLIFKIPKEEVQDDED